MRSSVQIRGATTAIRSQFELIAARYEQVLPPRIPLRTASVFWLDPLISGAVRTSFLLRRGASAILAMVACAWLAGLLLAPEWTERVFRSRWMAALGALWIFSFSWFLHPEINSGIAQGAREFWRGLEDVRDEINRWLR